MLTTSLSFPRHICHQTIHPHQRTMCTKGILMHQPNKDMSLITTALRNTHNLINPTPKRILLPHNRTVLSLPSTTAIPPFPRWEVNRLSHLLQRRWRLFPSNGNYQMIMQLYPPDMFRVRPPSIPNHSDTIAPHLTVPSSRTMFPLVLSRLKLLVPSLFSMMSAVQTTGEQWS